MVILAHAWKVILVKIVTLISTIAHQWFAKTMVAVWMSSIASDANVFKDLQEYFVNFKPNAHLKKIAA